MPLIAGVLLALSAGSLAFCALVIAAAWHYLRVRPAAAARVQPISVLKPLSGLDEGLEENLRAYFEQDYPEFEILFAVRRADDPAAAVAERLGREYARVPSRVIVTGEPEYVNAKVFALECMLAEARHDLLVMSDSDTRAGADLLRVINAEFQDERIGLATCPYRAVPGRSFWSRLEAIGMNTEFLGGVLVARMLDGMKFGVGPTMAARRGALERIGGIGRLRDYLAEDFVMGQLIAAAGFRAILSSYVIEHRIGTQALRPNFAHRLRWVRSTRRSRPAGYVGQLFTYPLPLALALAIAKPEWWPLLPATLAIRALAAWAAAGWVLHDRLTARYWWLTPVQDLVSFAFWIAGFFGNSIAWRGRRYVLLRDGRMRLAESGEIGCAVTEEPPTGG
jgi:ceramide glucosyltransferase